jgi:protein associated with RNAse G/E
LTRVVTRKLKFDASGQSTGLRREGKPDWEGEIIDEVPGRWLVVHFDHPEYAIREARAAHALQFFGMVQPLTILVCFDESGAILEWQCDACLPAVRRGGLLEFVDLDLDVIVNSDGTYYIRDLEDFEERSVSLKYSEDAKAAAWKGVATALILVKRGRYPFDGTAQRLLAKVRGQGANASRR